MARHRQCFVSGPRLRTSALRFVAVSSFVGGTLVVGSGAAAAPTAGEPAGAVRSVPAFARVGAAGASTESRAHDAGLVPFWPDVVDTLEVASRRQRLEERLAARSGFSTVLPLGPEVAASRDLSDLLDRVAGVHIHSYGGVGDFSTASIRGSAAAHVQVLLDGVPLASARDGFSNLGLVPVALLDYAIVHQGAQTLHLAGPPAMGVVELQTPAAVATDPLLAFSHGSHGTWGARGHYGVSWKRASLFVAGQQRTTDGDFSYLNRNGTSLNAEDDHEVERQNNDHVDRAILWKNAFRPADDVTLGYTGQFSRREEGVPGTETIQTNTTRYELERTRHQVQLGWFPLVERARRFWGRARFEVTGFRDQSDDRFANPDGEVGLGRVDEEATLLHQGGHLGLEVPARFLGLAFQALHARSEETWRPHDRLRDLTEYERRRTNRTSLLSATWSGFGWRGQGGRARRSSGRGGSEHGGGGPGSGEHGSGEYGAGEHGGAQRASGVGSDEHARGGEGASWAGAFGVEVGYRWDAARDNYTGPTVFGRPPEPQPTHTSRFEAPTLGVRVPLVAGLSLQANRGKYLRRPTFPELFGANGVQDGNPALVDETGLQWDLGLRFRQSRLESNIVYFENVTNDQIVLLQNSQRTVKAHNLARTWARGVTSSGFFSLALPADLGWELEAQWTWQEAEDLGPSPTYRHKEIPYLPENETYARTSLRRGPFRAEYALRARSAVYRDRYNTEEKRAAAQTLHDLGAELDLAGRWATLRCEVQNLDDRQTHDIEGYPLPGRTVHVEVVLRPLAAR